MKKLLALPLILLLVFASMGQVKIMPNGGGIKVGQTVRIKADTAAGATPIAVTALTNAKTETDATSYATSSIAPTANRLVVAIVASRAVVAEVTPTASGGGMTTWTQINTKLDTTNNIQITAFRALQASPSSAALTFSFGSTTQSWAIWSVFEIANVDTGGTNGSNAIVQSVVNEVDPGTSLTVTLGAFGSTNNGTVGCFYGTDPGNPGTTWVVGSGFTAIHHFRSPPSSETDAGMLTEYKTTNDTTVDSTFTNSVSLGIAMEIKAA